MSKPLAGIVRAVGGFVSPVAIVGLQAWTRLTGQQRARVVMVNERGEVLLVKGVIGHRRWTLPGGGIERGEQPIDAALREVYEELGVKLSELRQVAFVPKGAATNAGYDAFVFAAHLAADAFKDELINPYEILAVEWFSLAALPSDISQFARDAIEQAGRE